MSLDEVFKIVVVIFTVTNIGALGLETNMRAALKVLYSFRAIGLILLWGWIVGPALALLLIMLLPLAPGHAAGLLLISLAPTAPFFPMMVRRAQGDMSFAASFMMLSTVGVVVLLPVMAPWLIEGLAVDAWDLAKPLLVMVLLPLVIGVAIREIAGNAAEKLLPVVQKTGMLFLLITAVLTFVIYGRELLTLIGSFAPAAQLLFFVAITALAYTIHFGLGQQQRSAMALGMCTRNIAAVFAAFFGIADPPEGLFVMVVLVVPMALIIAILAARLFARSAPTTPAEEG